MAEARGWVRLALMLKNTAILCGMLTLLLKGQAPSDKPAERRDGCISVGPSGALVCHDGTLDIVTPVVPRLMATNRFTGLNTFALGVMIDTREEQRPDCQEAVRGTFWFKKNNRKDGPGRDSMQVCIRDGERFAWVGVAMHLE